MQKLSRYFSSSRATPVRSDDPDQADGRQHLIEIGEEVARGLYARPEVDTFLNSIAQSIARRFPGIEHVLIFVLAPNHQKVTLRAAAGPVSAQLLAQEHELDVGGLSPVGRVTLSGQHLLIRDYSWEPNYKPHALLSQTRSELVIPLGVDETISGALDVQSRQINGFNESTITILRAIANQIAMAVDSLQLYETSQRSLRENQALYQQTQTNLREIERLNYQLTGRAWSEYLRLQPQATALTLDMETGQVVHETEWTATLHQAATQRQTLVAAEADYQVVALPITVRNEVIGAMEFELAPGSDVSPAALDLLAAVGQRLGMALDNRRLLDETQRIAQREAMINDIGSDLQSATGVDAILQRAARHLQEALNAQEVAIRLGAAPIDQKSRPVQGETAL
jgi:GAF domain-containing protein